MNAIRTIAMAMALALSAAFAATGEAGIVSSNPPPVTFVTEFKNLSYAATSANEILDLYLPPGAGPFPTVVYVHGGGFQKGDKNRALQYGVVDRLRSSGYAVASLNYRLSGEATFPAAIQDVKTAVRWLRAHAQQYRLNSQKFGAWGDSAGGNLVSLLGTSCGAADLEGGSLGNADQSSCIQAVVDWYGPIDFLQMDQQYHDSGSSCPQIHNDPHSPESEYIGGPTQQNPRLVLYANPIFYISHEDPPFFIEHGTEDCTVPPEQSQLLYDALAATIGPRNVGLLYLEGAEHGDSAFNSKSNLDKVVQFLDQRLK